MSELGLLINKKNDIEFLLKKKHTYQDKIDKLYSEILEYNSFIKEIDIVVMNICKHNWEFSYNCGERIKICNKCKLEK